jgi:hypothetical protein
MLLTFLEKAAAYGLGYQDKEVIEIDEKFVFKPVVLTTLLDKDGNAKGYAYLPQEYPLSELIEKGICRSAKKDESEGYKKAKADFDKKVKDGVAKEGDFYYIH